MSTKYRTSHQLNREPTDYTTWSHAALQARHRELKAQILRDFPMPATETDEEAYIQRLLQEVKERTTPASPTHPNTPAVDGNELLQDVTQFIARYLQCSEHQRTLLALWVLHTYCFCAARVTPYLAIRSADKQSGKTLCLQLLSILCDRVALTSGGFTARDLALPMKEKPIDALLFDECHLTLGTRTRPRSPALRALLAGSFHLGLGHRNIAEERNAFLPKAFAGSGPLPEELADRCIPIILEPLDTRVAQPGKPQLNNKSGPQPPSAASFTLNPFENPRERERAPSTSSSPSISSTLSTEIPERFDLHHIADQIKPLRDRLERWAKNNFNLLTRRTLLPRSAFPPNLSPRQQDLCDPLLQIAALVGGPWIARALQACAIVFDLQSIFELRPNLQLLADVRDCFAHHNWPDRLPTEDLLDWTDSLPPRPWDADSPLNPRTIAHLLRPFHIHPREHRTERNKFRRGYELKDFQEPWQKYFPQSKIADKDKGCDTSAHNGARTETGVQIPMEKEVTVSPARKDDLPNPVKLGASSHQLAAQPSQIPNKDTVCDTISHARTVPSPAQAAEGSPQLASLRSRTMTAPPGRGSEANQPTQRFSQKPRAKSQELVSCDAKKSAASTDEPKVTAPAQQSRPNEILPGITCGDVFDDRWLHAFRR